MEYYNPDNYDSKTEDEYWIGIVSPNADDQEDYAPVDTTDLVDADK